MSMRGCKVTGYRFQVLGKELRVLLVVKKVAW